MAFNFGQKVITSKEGYFDDIEASPVENPDNTYTFSQNFSNNIYYIALQIQPLLDSNYNITFYADKQSGETTILKNCVIYPLEKYNSEVKTDESKKIDIERQLLVEEELQKSYKADYQYWTEQSQIAQENYDLEPTLSNKQKLDEAIANKTKSQQLYNNSQAECNQLNLQKQELERNINTCQSNTSIEQGVFLNLYNPLVNYSAIRIVIEEEGEPSASPVINYMKILQLKELLTNDLVVKKIGLQGLPESSIFINNSYIKMGSTGVFELDDSNSNISSLKIFPADGLTKITKISSFIIDYEKI